MYFLISILLFAAVKAQGGLSREFESKEVLSYLRITGGKLTFIKK
jgi:hypothetical protein